MWVFRVRQQRRGFFEICPICNWQNDGKTGDQYSSCNHSTVNDYKKTDFFQKK
ncbi:CPCC family cysteine-rich protein [Escherichia fergusonii]|uniref:CPCC family cysteine-rich protein n=1 Tax=Escherichia fergusonii TaxID=564 RepID=UPI00210D02BE|nr:CPCC family cysteine-rich protein [Escherichia fergusonii]